MRSKLGADLLQDSVIRSRSFDLKNPWPSSWRRLPYVFLSLLRRARVLRDRALYWSCKCGSATPLNIFKRLRRGKGTPRSQVLSNIHLRSALLMSSSCSHGTLLHIALHVNSLDYLHYHELRSSTGAAPGRLPSAVTSETLQVAGTWTPGKC